MSLLSEKLGAWREARQADPGKLGKNTVRFAELDELLGAIVERLDGVSMPDLGTVPVPELAPAPEPRLCYIDETFAYFTTQDIAKQWGDDWNDSPYEHNAGEPYRPRTTVAKRLVDGAWEDVPPEAADAWTIVKVAYDGLEAETPAGLRPPHSGYSVEDINARKVPWLSDPMYGVRGADGERPDPEPIVWAGATLSEFVAAIESRGGVVYAAQVSRDVLEAALLALQDAEKIIGHGRVGNWVGSLALEKVRAALSGERIDTQEAAIRVGRRSR